MANREIIAVEIDDSAFQDFLQKFNEHQEIMKSLPSYWAAVSKEVEKQKTNFEKISAKVSASAQSAAAIEKAQEGVGKLLEGAAISFGLLSTHGKHFAANIHRSTQELMKWTKLTSVFSGLLGAGGLYGINRMATSAAGQRTSAMGLGVSYTEQASFLTNFQRLGNPAGILQGFSEGLSTPVGKAQIAHLLGHRPTGDAAETASEAILKFKEFVDQTPDDQLKKRLEALGYTNLGLGVEQAKIIRGIPREELEGSVRDYREGKTSALAIDPEMAKKWTDFTTQMELASRELETVFAKDLVNLTPGLTHLSDAFVHLVDNLLKDGSPIKGWIDSLGSGIGKFADKLGDKTFQTSVSQFVRDSGDAVRLVESAVAAAPGGVAALIGMYLAGKIGGRTAVALGEALGAVSGVGLGTVAAAGALGATLYPQPLNAGENERARQQKFGTSPRPTGHPATKTLGQEDAGATPSQNERAATSGSGARTQTPGGPGGGITPVAMRDGGAPLGDATHHPRRYQGTLSVDGQTFDYASGSVNRGRGSSPFGEHPITGFDPSAMHGRGGGAFRTKDVYDAQIGDKRGAVEIHMSNQDDVNRVETAGCYGIPRSEWPAAKASIQNFMAHHPEGSILKVLPDGRAEIVSRNAKASQSQEIAGGIQAKNKVLDGHDYTQPIHNKIRNDRHIFGHPRARGTHPADLERGKPTGVDINNHTGSSTSVDIH